MRLELIRSQRRLPRALQPPGHSQLAPVLGSRTGERGGCRREHVKRAAAALLARSALPLGLRRTYRLLASGALTLDLGVGAGSSSSGPLVQAVAAPQEVVFDVLPAPYLGRTPRAFADKLQVWERGQRVLPRRCR